MRVSDKLTLIDKIGRELQSRFTYDDLIAFLNGHSVQHPPEFARNSKWLYSKNVLAGVPTEIILSIAEELEIDLPLGAHIANGNPRNWVNSKSFRLFISHIAEQKIKAKRLKDCFTPFGIDGFVAHEDIHPTLEWQDEIERALHSMDALIAIHTPGFSSGIWTQQEIGFAVGRGIKIISLKMGEDPMGFIAKRQAVSRRDRTAEQIALEVNAILGADPQTAAKLLSAQKAHGLVLADQDEAIPF